MRWENAGLFESDVMRQRLRQRVPRAAKRVSKLGRESRRDVADGAAVVTVIGSHPVQLRLTPLLGGKARTALVDRASLQA